MFLVEEGTSAIVEDVLFHLERDVRHGPEGITNTLAHNWVQALMEGVVACF